jgi:hypothetical protein
MGYTRDSIENLAGVSSTGVRRTGRLEAGRQPLHTEMVADHTFVRRTYPWTEREMR